MKNKYSIGEEIDIFTIDYSYSSSGSGASFESEEVGVNNENHYYYEFSQLGEIANNNLGKEETWLYANYDPYTYQVEEINEITHVTQYDELLRISSLEVKTQLNADWGQDITSDFYEYQYEGASSNRLSSSTEFRSSSIHYLMDDYTDLREEFIQFTYDYAGLEESDINSPFDFAERWGTGTSTYSNSEGFKITHNLYMKETSRSSDGLNLFEEHRILTSSQGDIVEAHLSSDRIIGPNESSTNLNTYDHNSDGLVDEMISQSSRASTNSQFEIFTTKYDDNSDSLADRLTIEQQRTTPTTTSQIIYEYDSSEIRPLTITINVDSNNDGVFDISRTNYLNRTLGRNVLSMGQHAASFSDVLQ